MDKLTIKGLLILNFFKNKMTIVFWTGLVLVVVLIAAIVLYLRTRKNKENLPMNPPPEDFQEPSQESQESQESFEDKGQTPQL